LGQDSSKDQFPYLIYVHFMPTSFHHISKA
jgi:hypothetical protein